MEDQSEICRSAEAGLFYRIGSRIMVQNRGFIPAGFVADMDTEIEHPEIFVNLFSGKKFDGYSYEVKGWENV